MVRRRRAELALGLTLALGVAPAVAQTHRDHVRVEPTIPADEDGGAFDNGLVNAAVFAWNESIALNWPAQPRTRDIAAGERFFGTVPGLLVWETFRAKVEVYPGTAVLQAHQRAAAALRQEPDPIRPGGQPRSFDRLHRQRRDRDRLQPRRLQRPDRRERRPNRFHQPGQPGFKNVVLLPFQGRSVIPPVNMGGCTGCHSGSAAAYGTDFSFNSGPDHERAGNPGRDRLLAAAARALPEAAAALSPLARRPAVDEARPREDRHDCSAALEAPAARLDLG